MEIDYWMRNRKTIIIIGSILVIMYLLFTSLILSIMELIVEVLIEVGSIVLMGGICFTIYVYGKIFLIKIGLIDKEQDDESIKDGTD